MPKGKIQSDDGDFNPKPFVELKSLLFTIMRALEEKMKGPSVYFEGGRIPMKEFREKMSALRITQQAYPDELMDLFGLLSRGD